MASPTTTTLPNGTKLPYAYRGLSVNTTGPSSSTPSSSLAEALRHESVDLGLDSPKTGMPPSPQLDSGYVNPRTYPATFTARKGSVMDPRRTSLASKGGEKGRMGSVSDPRSPVAVDKEMLGVPGPPMTMMHRGSASSASSSSPTESGSSTSNPTFKQPLGTVREVEPYFDEPETAREAAAAAKHAKNNERRESEYTLSSASTNGGLAPPTLPWGAPESRRRSSAALFKDMGMGRRRSSVMDSIKSYIKPGAGEEQAEVV